MADKYRKLFIAAFVLVAMYAAGLTCGLGPIRIVGGLEAKVITPVLDTLLDRRPELSDYTEVACPTGDTFSIAYFGQSNATNTVEPKAADQFPPNLLQYDWKSSKCFDYREPLLGADFTRGNNLTYAVARIASETDKPVIVVPFGFGPSTIMEWAYGEGAVQHQLVMERLKESKISPQVFLWHQGESDVPIDGVRPEILAEIPHFKRPDMPFKQKVEYRIGMTGESYKAAMSAIVNATLTEFPDAYFGIALVSIAPCLRRHEQYPPLRAAQKDVAAAFANVFISADSDAIRGIDNRYDTCHFSDLGARKLSNEYFESISSLGVFDSDWNWSSPADREAPPSAWSAKIAIQRSGGGARPIQARPPSPQSSVSSCGP